MHARDITTKLEQQGYATPTASTDSTRTFADGAKFRVEIPSIEGPTVLSAVLDEAARRDVAIQRISQGSGVMMLTDKEIRDMADLGAQANCEVSLFLGPRDAWGTGSQARATDSLTAAVRGHNGLLGVAAEALRAADLGIRSLLVGDLGALVLLANMRSVGELPADLVLKMSAYFAITNGATARTLAQLGADTLNVAADLSASDLGHLRGSCDIPLDLYIEAPDNLGGSVRFYDLPDIIRAAAPVYIKMGIRNAPSVYPSGAHLDATAVALGRERVRRAELSLRLISELAPELLPAERAERPADLGVPPLLASVSL